MKPEYVFDIFLKWVSNKVSGDDLEKMAHNMLHEAWKKQREEFLKRFGNHLPPYVEKLLNDPDQPGNFNLKLKIHMNFS